jgi:hypothetical protein
MTDIDTAPAPASGPWLPAPVRPEDLTDNDRAVGRAVLAYTDTEGRLFGTLGDIEEESGVHIVEVNRSLARLVGGGWIRSLGEDRVGFFIPQPALDDARARRGST